MATLIGKRVGSCEVTAKLGEGGMGESGERRRIFPNRRVHAESKKILVPSGRFPATAEEP